MKLRLLFLIVFPVLVSLSMAQHPGDPGPFAAGYMDDDFTTTLTSDPTLSVRIYYPATTTGANQPVANGVFPTVAFGHGFNLNYLDYENLCNHLASWGFVVISPDVQNGFNVDHEEYARELSACLEYGLELGLATGGDFFQKIDTMSGVYGHSMGGGASGLVHSVYPTIDAVSGLASAETNPSAIAALANYSGPYQVISGSSDNTAPENTNQVPMYNAATGEKQWISISGGAHCKFTDGTTICDIVSSPGSISRSEQQALTNTYTTAFFAYYLQNDLSMLPWICGDSVKADSAAGILNFQTNVNCMVTGLSDPGTRLGLYPNPVTGAIVTINGFSSWEQIRLEELSIYSQLGVRKKAEATLTAEGIQLEVGDYPPGIYWVRESSTGKWAKFLKQ